jgi:hypothetical protein
VDSEIFVKKEANEYKIGRTSNNGSYLNRLYKCSDDKNLIAKPVDKTYFNSSAEPCKSPQTLWVISRKTPKGKLAFSNFMRAFEYADGTLGQISYKSALDVSETESPVILAGKHPTNDNRIGCKIEYNLTLNKSKLKLTPNGWETIAQSSQPANEVVEIDQDQFKRYERTHTIDWQRFNPDIQKTPSGFSVMFLSPCDLVDTQKHQFKQVIEYAYGKKVELGEFKDGDVDTFIKGGIN